MKQGHIPRKKGGKKDHNRKDSKLGDLEEVTSA
jgi:hypothetical protein